MFKNFNFIIEAEKRTINLPIHLAKMTDQKTSLKTGYQTESGIRLVKYASVITKGDIEQPRKTSDIEQIIERSKTTSVFCYQDGTEGERMIPVDKELLKRVIPNDRDIKVIFSTPYSNIKPYMFDGSHYYFELHGVVKKKVRTFEQADKRMYNIIYHGLKESAYCLVAKYVCFNREKFCVIYPDETKGLILSNIIHSNYFRPVGVTHIINQGELELDKLIAGGTSRKRIGELNLGDKPLFLHIFEKINQSIQKETIESSQLRDKHEEILQEIITQSKDALIEGKPVDIDLEQLIESDGELDEFL